MAKELAWNSERTSLKSASDGYVQYTNGNATAKKGNLARHSKHGVYTDRGVLTGKRMCSSGAAQRSAC